MMMKSMLNMYGTKKQFSSMDPGHVTSHVLERVNFEAQNGDNYLHAISSEY
jgi:hypothetical protein